MIIAVSLFIIINRHYYDYLFLLHLIAKIRLFPMSSPLRAGRRGSDRRIAVATAGAWGQGLDSLKYDSIREMSSVSSGGYRSLSLS